MCLAVHFVTVLFILIQATSFALPSYDSNSSQLEPVVAAYYTGWHATEGFPLSAVSWDKYNTLIYAFA